MCVSTSAREALVQLSDMGVTIENREALAAPVG
jgi:hypothetical protein